MHRASDISHRDDRCGERRSLCNFMNGRRRSCGKKSMPLKTGMYFINTEVVS